MNRQQLIKIAPNLSIAAADMWVETLGEAMDRFKILLPEEKACFLGQALVESGNLTSLVENLAYRPQAIMANFRGRFTPAEAAEFGYVPGKQKADQRMIANIAYGGRYGNGDRHTDDGWRYRGRGPFQLTFKDNYLRCGKAIGKDLISSPQLLEEPEAGALSAAWFWTVGNKGGTSLNSFARAGKISHISLIINPGGLHLVERMNASKRALDILEGRA